MLIISACHLLRRGEAVLEPAGVAAEGDDFGVVEETVEEGGGEDLVAEDASAFGEALVEVMIMEPRSYLSETSWKTMLVSARSGTHPPSYQHGSRGPS